MTTPRPTTIEDSPVENAAAVPIVRFISAKGHEFWARPETEDVGVFEYVVDNNEYDLPRQFEPDDVIIDIGAHIGSFSYAVLLRGAGKVYAYEAHPDNHAIALKNLTGFEDRLECHNLAVWRSDVPDQTLHNEDITGYTKTGGISVLWNNEGVAVQTISLDAILSEASNGFRDSIRLLKIDCEGAEYPILFTSKRLEIVEEIRGEYHEMKPQQIPERAKTAGFDHFNRFALKDFFEAKGWTIELEPKAEANGLFHAFRPYPGAPQNSNPNAEISVEKLMAQIRFRVARREAQGKTSFINASSELFKLLSADNFAGQLSAFNYEKLTNVAETAGQFRLQPAFAVRANNSYHVNDLLQYHDHEFIWNAYRALLKREPDEEGLCSYLDRLRNGSRNKIDILASLRFSPEGRRANVTIEGLRIPAAIRQLYRLPVIGYLAELAVTFARLPLLVRSQRQIENHLIAQQDRLVGHIEDVRRGLSNSLNQTNRASAEYAQRSSSFERALVEKQQKMAELQHQQVTALFREQQKLMNQQASVDSLQATETKLGVRTQAILTPEPIDLDKLQAALEDQLRGAPEAIKIDLEFYLSLLREAGVASEILDLGSGRGIWLELLMDKGLHATGVERNRALVEEGQRRGLQITEQSALEYLRRLSNESVQAVTAFHLIEHLEFTELIQLLAEIRRVLKPNGLVVFETPNPKNLVVGACNFYADPTHRKPVFPETLQFLMQSLGFDQTRIEYLHPVEGSPFDNSEPGSRELHTWLFGPRDFFRHRMEALMLLWPPATN